MLNTLPFSQNHSTLFEEIEKLKQSFSFETEDDEEKFYKKNNLLFIYISANLHRLLPQIPYPKHKSIFEKLLFNLQLLTIEEQNPTFFAPHFKVIDKENILEKAKSGVPFLFCCFHLGSYSLLPTLLTYEDLDFGFLLNQTLMNRKGKGFLEAHQKLSQQIETQKKVASNSKMQLINVEENKGIWKAIRMLKEGKSLIIYADGNTGTNYSKQEIQNTVAINFLGEDLQVRKGIAFLSYVCNIPIVPIITSRTQKEELSLERKFEFLPAIYPNFEGKNSTNKDILKEKFAVETMQKLYSILEKEVIKDDKDFDKVDKWEGWIFVNKFFKRLQKTIPLDNNQNYFADNVILREKNVLFIFNQKRFTIIENNKENIQNQKITLFDKFTYRFFPVSDLLYEIIIYFSVPKNLYLPNPDTQNSHSPISISSDLPLIDYKLGFSKTFIPMSGLEKLIQKNILVQNE